MKETQRSDPFDFNGTLCVPRDNLGQLTVDRSILGKLLYHAAFAAHLVGHLLHVLRDNLRRADAFVSTAEELVERSWGEEGDDRDEDEDDDSGIQRRRMRVEYLIEAGKLAVRAAGYTSDQLAAELAAHRGDA